MIRSPLPRTLTLFLLLVAAVPPGCFSQLTAEGRFEESEESGRILANAGRWNMQMMRLRILQFDDEAAGIVELLTARSQSNFSSVPTVYQDQGPLHFCTRIERATVRNDVLVFQFVDRLGRIWRVTGDLTDDGLEGRLERVTAAGEVLDASDPANLDALMPADQLYYTEAATPDPTRQLILTRLDDSVQDEELFCVDYQRNDQLDVLVPELPDGATPTGESAEHHIYAALILTHPFLGIAANQPVDGLNAKSVVTHTLDADWDLDIDKRTLHVRLDPEAEDLSAPTAHLAVGTIVVFEDLPDEKGEYNQVWNNVLYEVKPSEPVLAYLHGKLVVFNGSEDAIERPPRRLDGTRMDTVALFSEATREDGWAFYSFFEDGSAQLPDDSRVRLIQEIYGQPGTEAPLLAVPPQCAYCYPSAGTADDLPEGAPAQECVFEGANACPTILPMLYM